LREITINFPDFEPLSEDWENEIERIASRVTVAYFNEEPFGEVVINAHADLNLDTFSSHLMELLEERDIDTESFKLKYPNSPAS